MNPQAVTAEAAAATEDTITAAEAEAADADPMNKKIERGFKMEINYHLPSFTTHYSLNLLIFDYMKQHPEYFRDGIKIASVFGSFDGAAWNGGRNVSGRKERS